MTSRPANAPTLYDWLAAEPFAVTMSAGFFGFFAHTGMLQALAARGLEPNRLSGTSAGALVAGLYGSGVDPAEIGHDLTTLERRDFWDPRPGLGLLRGRRFRDLLYERLRVRNFADCRVPVVVSTHDVFGRRPRPLAAGDLAQSIHASCAVPFMFHPVWIDGRPFVDGGVSDRPGLAGMPAGTRILYHHLATRSPWRRRHSPALEIPRRANMLTLVIERLPRVSPFALDRGPRALAVALTATAEALACPIVDGLVRVSGRAD